MGIELNGKKIKILNTLLSDINKIIEFENANEHFICRYPKEKHIELLRDENCLHLSIIRKDNNKLVGHIIIFGLNNNNKSLEFRRITINQKGFGFGREALKLIKILCFENLEFHRLWLDVYDNNIRAIKLYESEGFVQEGLLRDNTKIENAYRSQRIYSILEHEFIKK